MRIKQKTVKRINNTSKVIWMIGPVLVFKNVVTIDAYKDFLTIMLGLLFYVNIVNPVKDRHPEIRDRKEDL